MSKLLLEKLYGAIEFPSMRRRVGEWRDHVACRNVNQWDVRAARVVGSQPSIGLGVVALVVVGIVTFNKPGRVMKS